MENGCKSVAYTYTDPSIFFEYTVDASKLAHRKGLKNVLVTAGYLNEKPMEEIFAVSDAANIDFKGNDAYYEKIVLGKVKYVMRYIKNAIRSGVFVELTNLIVPTLNDSKEDIDPLAIVSDRPFDSAQDGPVDSPIPRFDFDEVARLTDFLVARLQPSRPPRAS